MEPADLRIYANLFGVFCFVFTIVLLLGSRAGDPQVARVRALRQRLEGIAGERPSGPALSLDREAESGIPEAWRRLLGARLTRRVLLLLVRSGTRTPAQRILAGMAALAVTGALLAWSLDLAALAPMGAVAGALIPLTILRSRAAERMQRFASQFPEALDFMARSMRTGQDLQTAMRIVGEEFPEPSGAEFRRAIDEVGYGVTVDEALANMAERIGCNDLGYLIACVAIQRETGGSLAGAMATLARTVRERFVFEGKVRVLSAQGRLSAIVLCLLPIAVLGFMYVSNRDYVSVFWTTRLGEELLALATLLLFGGSAWVMKTVRVKV
jgi:tight adherence protein B